MLRVASDLLAGRDPESITENRGPFDPQHALKFTLLATKPTLERNGSFLLTRLERPITIVIRKLGRLLRLGRFI
jgi:hypothetical protein